MPYGAGGEPLGRQLDRLFQGKKKPHQESVENQAMPVVPTAHSVLQPERNLKRWTLLGAAFVVLAGFVGFRSRRLWTAFSRSKET